MTYNTRVWALYGGVRGRDLAIKEERRETEEKSDSWDRYSIDRMGYERARPGIDDQHKGAYGVWLHAHGSRSRAYC